MKKKILVTGANGLVGSAVKQILEEQNEFSVYWTGQKNKDDLREKETVQNIFDFVRPDFVIHTAARVGGIGRNLNSPAQQFSDNILINTHVIDACVRVGVKKLISFSSVCAFPAKEPIFKEENLHDGEPFPAHRSYAYSKRMVDIQIEACGKQYGLSGCSIIPTNIFGERDFYNIEDGHVVPSLIYKCHMAKQENKPLQIWGDGSPVREFVYSKDIARVCVELLKIDSMPQRLIVSGDAELRISELVDKITDVFEYKNIEYLTDKPNGQLKRPTSHELFNKTFPEFKFTNINESLKNSVEWFIKNYPNVRL